MGENLKYCHVTFNPNKSFILDHVHIPYNEQITFHTSEVWELSYILKGSGTRIVGDTVETFFTGEIVLLPPHVPHGWFFDEFDQDAEGKIENISLFFPEECLTNLSRNFGETTECISLIKQIRDGFRFEGKTLRELQKILKNMLLQNDMEQLGSFIRILTFLPSEEAKVVGHFQKPNKSSLKLQEVSRFMVHNYHKKITLDEVARHIGMNKSSFCIFYRREKGKFFFCIKGIPNRMFMFNVERTVFNSSGDLRFSWF